MGCEKFRAHTNCGARIHNLPLNVKHTKDISQLVTDLLVITDIRDLLQSLVCRCHSRASELCNREATTNFELSRDVNRGRLSRPV